MTRRSDEKTYRRDDPTQNVRHRTFLGVGVPPRPGACQWCEKELAVGSKVVQHACTDAVFCSEACLLDESAPTPKRGQRQ